MRDKLGDDYTETFITYLIQLSWAKALGKNTEITNRKKQIDLRLRHSNSTELGILGSI